MDVSNPLRSIAPTVDADVLLVLARAHIPLTGARVAELAGRSHSQVRAVLQRLVEDGLVDAEQHGQAVSYRWNREHVLTDAVQSIAEAADRAEQRLVDAVADWKPSPHALVVFGSFARRDGGTDSDVDLLLVRRDEVDDEDEGWARQRHALATGAERWTGNRTQIMELSIAELAIAIDHDEALIEALRAHARVLVGPPVRQLFGSDGAVR